MEELASQSLDLVSRELTQTLDTARGEIEDYVDGQSNSEALVRAAGLLHLAAGALKIVEIHGAALLAEEMEQTCHLIHESHGQDNGQAVEALTRAMVQLPAYLERLLAGGSDVALVLLPLLNDLRQARNQPLVSEGTLLLLKTGPFERLRRGSANDDGQEFDNEVPALAQKLRPKFQAALLGFIRGDAGHDYLSDLIDVCDAIEARAESEPVRQLWAVTAGVLGAMRNGDFEPSVTIKRLFGQADRQLKRLIDSGEAVFVKSPPVDLMNSLLYYVARAQTRDDRIEELRQTFGVDAMIPGAEEIEKAREDLAGPSVRLMHTVAAAIKEDLGEVKDVLDIFVRMGMQNIDELRPQLDLLKKIGDTLGVLGFEAARNRIQAEAQQLAAIVAAETVEDAAVLERIAASLLDVEDMLDRELVASGTPEHDEEPADDDGLETRQYRHVTAAVMRECIVNLAKVKEVVVKVLDDPASLKALDQVEPQMRGIIAGLLMLNKNRAVNVIERIGRTVTTRLAPGTGSLKSSLVERLADAIVSIEYYMETVALGRTDPFYMLDNANRCLDLIDNVAKPKSAEAVPAPEAPPPPPSVPSEPEKLSVMSADEDRSEPELVEIFIEEAKEELANIRQNLPRWKDAPGDAEALIAVRRSFHTLKGSGRVIGAELIGEFAWSVENLLNRVINQTLETSPDIVAVVDDAVAALPAVIEQLETGIAPAVDVNALIGRARALAEVRTGDDAAPPAPDAGAVTSGMDPVLQQIFTKEVREHLATIRDFVAANAGAEPPVSVTEALHRASHTLFGSARMANCAPAIELTGIVDGRLRQAFESGTGLGDGATAAIGRFADEIERLCGALEDDGPFTPDPDLADELRAIEVVSPAADADPDQPAGDSRQAVAADEAPEPDDAPGPDEAQRPHDAAEPDAARASPAALEAAAYDPEIAAIFCEEAAELLDQAETEMQALRQSPGSESAMSELARVMHTLKGGARLAGITVMGDLSHALETLMPRVRDGNADGFRLLQRGIDQLQQMRDAVDSGLAVTSAATLIEEMEAFADAATDAPVTADSGSSDELPASSDVPIATDESFDDDGIPELSELDALPEEEDAAAGPADFDALETEAFEAYAESTIRGLGLDDETGLGAVDSIDADVPDTAEAAAAKADESVAEGGEPADGDEPRPADDEPDVEEQAPATLPAAAASRPAERAEIARVDAALLDELLNGAGEISIFQSRLNQQIHSIDFHLGELGQTVTRLREQLRSLEAETEAQILHRHQGESTGDEEFDPLELDRYSTIQQLSRALAETSNDVASINELLHGLTSEADTLLTQQSRVTTELSDGLMQTRMVPFDRHSSRLARIVRQAAGELDKQAELSVDGAHSQLDRQILEAILPALEHLLRNAVVHGIETPAERRSAGKPEAGTVHLNIRREGSEVIIDVSDDGAGLDTQAIRRKAIEKGLIRDDDSTSDEDIVELILLPGFSTADELTQSAGRGVGMDVVDNEVKRLGGSLRITTEAGRGSHFLVRLPYTLAITHALVVNVGDETFALPLPTIEGIARVRREELLDMLTQDDPRLVQGETNYRVQHLGSLVGGAPSSLPEEEGAVSLVLVRAGDNSAALLTDSLEGSREIIVKTLGPHVASVDGVTGATILGDGRIVVILDAATLVRAQAAEPAPLAPAKIEVEEPVRALTGLVVDDSITMRRVTQRLLERRGVRVLTARDGLDAIEVLREHDADFIVLDIEMPRMDGYQFATHVRNDAKLKELPIIMVTSRSGEKHRARAIEIGVNDYLGKPYQEGELVRAIETLVGRSL